MGELESLIIIQCRGKIDWSTFFVAFAIFCDDKLRFWFSFLPKLKLQMHIQCSSQTHPSPSIRLLLPGYSIFRCDDHPLLLPGNPVVQPFPVLMAIICRSVLQLKMVHEITSLLSWNIKPISISFWTSDSKTGEKQGELDGNREQHKPFWDCERPSCVCSPAFCSHRYIHQGHTSQFQQIID